jgi:DNA-binding winged helix-turn-helix (wHTH) protein
MRLTFGDCVFDSGTREIFRGGKLVSVSPKAFHLLEILIERRPDAISKDELHTRLWPSTFVSDANLPNIVAELRTALGDSAQKSRIIRTVPRFGYAFRAEVVRLERKGSSLGETAPVFKLIWEDREIALGEGENLLGRDPLAVACVDVHSVSRHHARIRVAGDKATLEDLGSKNGTYLRGKKLQSPARLGDGDEIRIGTVPMTFRRFSRGMTTQTVRSR